MTNGVGGDVLEVFSTMGGWLTSELKSIEPLFYSADTGLTFIGTCSVAALGIAITLLLVNVIKDFIRFR